MGVVYLVMLAGEGSVGLSSGAVDLTTDKRLKIQMDDFTYHISIWGHLVVIVVSKKGVGSLHCIYEQLIHYQVAYRLTGLGMPCDHPGGSY